MWSDWSHKPTAERPALWWRQLEGSPRKALPFAHLFPRPPEVRRPPPSEAQQLVSELVAPAPEEGMAEVVTAYRAAAPCPTPAPRGPVLASPEPDPKEQARWGDDGGRVVAWFDRGEIMGAWPTEPVHRLDHQSGPRGLARLYHWIRRLFTKPDSLELASAEY